MRLLRLLCIILFLSATVHGQTYKVFKGDTINRVDLTGKKQGLWRKYYASDSLFSEGHFKNGIAKGTFRTFYKNGVQQSELKYRGLTNISDAIIYSDSGKVMGCGKYLGTEKDSLWIFFEGDGSKTSEEFYKDGKTDGIWKIFYPNGKVSRSVVYKNGVKNGPYKEFFQSGKPKIDATMKLDEFDGLFTIYHPDGKVWEKGAYKNGLKIGLWTRFKETGEKESEDMYKDGKSLNPKKDEEQ